ncbi:septum formation family protein [Nocardioidaceae bacterium]|nr:septum formation family protein [Nocardioidaceae bacterium]
MTRVRLTVASLALLLPLAACGGSEDDPVETPPSASAAGQSSPPTSDAADGSGGAIEQSDAPALADAPQLGACRDLTPEDVAQPADDTDPVACAEKHTAQTFVVGSFPERVTRGTAWDSPALGAYIYDECTRRFAAFVGGDESIRLRSLVSWAWFRPTEEQWADGARWFRCDIVGGTPAAASYAPLPRDAKGLFARGPVEQWMQCVDGPTITSAPATPCTEKHTWRAIRFVKVTNGPKEKYPGDKIVASRARDGCSDQVADYLDYQPEYEFAYSWFHEAEWKAGNRVAVCWARSSA